MVPTGSTVRMNIQKLLVYHVLGLLHISVYSVFSNQLLFDDYPIKILK